MVQNHEIFDKLAPLHPSYGAKVVNKSGYKQVIIKEEEGFDNLSQLLEFGDKRNEHEAFRVFSSRKD